MDVERFFQAYGIPYVTSGHKHARAGWCNTPCPFCSGHAGYHLGYNKEKDFWCCWRCGFHTEYEVIMAFTGSRAETAKVRRLYQSSRGHSAPRSAAKINSLRNCTFPPEYELTNRAKQYLLDRGYNPERIEHDWNISYGGNFGAMAYRIIIPIYYEGKRISYTGRDITGKQSNKYITAPENIQTFNPKHTLYGLDNSDTKTVLVVEGPMDVWRFGYGAVGTFGVKYTKEQIRLLATRYENIYVLYDADRHGKGADRTASQKQAIELSSILGSIGKKVSRCSLTDIGVNDPGDLTSSQAKRFMSEIFMGA